ALIVGLRFRSVGAPLATLACAATAYMIAIRVVVWLAGRMGVTLPPDLDPVLVVLLLGVTTDYTVFFLDGMRAQVAGGVPRVRAVTGREGGGREPARPRRKWAARWNLSMRAARLAAARPMALLIAAAGTAGLLAAAWGAHTIHLGSPLIRELPASSPAARA